MRPNLLHLFGLAGLLLTAACAPDGTRELNEIVLADETSIERYRYGYAFGTVARLPLPEGTDVALGERVGDAAEEVPFAVAGANRLGDDEGAPFLHDRFDAALDPPLRAARIPLSSDLRLTVDRPVDRAWYFDGDRWFDLPRELSAPRVVDFAPRPIGTPFRGTGSLTPAEADALARGLAADGEPKVVSWVRPEPVEESRTVLDALSEGEEEDDRPAWAPRPPDGVDEYRHTLLYVQSSVETDAGAYRAPERTSIHEVIARGAQGAAPSQDRFVLLRDPSELRTFWNQVHPGSSPPLPEVRFGRETLLGIRLAQRPTGGYGIEVVRTFREADELFVDLRLTEPDPDGIQTQALTAPWALITVLGSDADVVWFRDPDDGTLFAVARSD